MTLMLAPSVTTSLHWELARHNQRWQLEKATANNHVALEQMTLTRTQKSQTYPVAALDVFELRTDSEINSQPGADSAEGLAAIFPLAVHAGAEMKTSGLVIEDTDREVSPVSAQAGHQLQASFKGRLDSFEKPPSQLQFQAEQTLTLKKLDAQTEGQRFLVDDFILSLKARAASPSGNQTNTPLSFEAQVDSRAGQVHLNQAAETPDGELDVSFTPTLQLQTSGLLHSFDDIPQTLSAQFQPLLTVEQLHIRQGAEKKGQHYRVARQNLEAKGELREGRLNLDGKLDFEGVAIPEVAKTFGLENQLRLVADTALSQPSLDLQTTLDKHPLVQLSLQADNRPEVLDLQHRLHLDLSPKLAAYHPAAEALRKTGHALVDWTGRFSVTHREKDILLADLGQLEHWPLQGQGDIRLSQQSRPADPDGVILSAPASIAYSVSKDKDYQTELKIDAKGVQAPPLQKPLPVQLQQQARFTWPLTKSEVNGKLDIDGREALRYQLDADDRPQRLKLNSRLSVATRPDWQRYLSDLQVLEQLGRISANLDLNTELRHPNSSILDFDTSRLAQTQADMALNVNLSQSPDHPGTLLQLRKPLTYSHQLKWSERKVQGEGRFKLADAEWVGQAAVNDVSGRFRIDADSGMALDNTHLTFELNKGQLRWLGQDPALELGELLTPLALQLAVAPQGERIDLQQMELRLGDGLLAVQAQGDASLDGKNAQLETTVTAELRPNMLKQPVVSGQGSVELPLRVSMLDGRQLSLDGEMRFQDFGITTDQFRLHRLNGNLAVAEELLWDSEQLRFRYLIDADPFQRVDYSRIQPFLSSRQSLTFDQVVVGDKPIGPGLANISLQQNLLRLKQFDLALFGGHLTGQLYLDTRPGAWKVGLLSRVSQLDLRQLLPDNATQRAGGYAPVSARTAVEFDLNQRLLQGRIDITEISREQLLQLLDIVDPEHRDEQLARVRAALRIAFPRWVSVDMRQGLMDLDVAISALPRPLQARGLPLTPLIQHFAGDALQSLQQLPLEN